MPVLITTRTRTADLGKPRIIVIGRGFAFLFDRFNHHPFQPPLYPVHTSGPDTHSILFAFREKLWSKPDFFRAVNSYCGRADTACKVLIKRTLTWAAGAKGHPIEEPATGAIGMSGRPVMGACKRVKSHDNIFAIGDIARMGGDPNFVAGHPQMAPPATRQGRRFARNFLRWFSKQEPIQFRYRHFGSMATAGKNHAVVDPVIVFFSGIWRYFSYDQSNRIIISRSCEGI
jgi:NADH dehydrogenase FAD-containing subunit